MAVDADWSFLPSDFVRSVADAFLATNDLDYYMVLRAVCHDWRSATADPSGLDPRFHPHRWILLDEAPETTHLEDTEDPVFLSVDVEVDDSRLFLNLDTGRFLRKRLPMLRNYTYLATANGLLVLEAPPTLNDGDNMRPLCVLNPFTGSMIRFRVSPSHHFDRSVAVASSSWSPTVLLNFYDFDHLAWVDETLIAFCPPAIKPYPGFGTFAAVVRFQGCVYVANMTGSVAVVDFEFCQLIMEPAVVIIIARKWERASTFLLDNAGEMLLVRLPQYNPVEIFRVIRGRNGLMPVTSIGNRALFLGVRCSLSLDAGRLPGIDANCIYYGDDMLDESGICRIHLEDDRGSRHLDERLIPEIGDPWDPIDPSASRPTSLAHVLVSYCMGNRR